MEGVLWPAYSEIRFKSFLWYSPLQLWSVLHCLQRSQLVRRHYSCDFTQQLL